MNKRKAILPIMILGTGALSLIYKIWLYKRIKELEHKTKELAHYHNDFCLVQGKCNKSMDEQIINIQEEIGSVYEHIEGLLDMQETKYTDEKECKKENSYCDKDLEKQNKQLSKKQKGGKLWHMYQSQKI
ncbi:hypothetical protein ACFJYC_06440 [Enterococcus faecalis]